MNSPRSGKRISALTSIVAGLFLAHLDLAVADAQETPPPSVFDNPVSVSVSGSSPASLRGLHVVDTTVVWSSGSKGTVLRSDDGGESWTAVSPAGAGELDFRDVHAWNDREAIVISAGTPTRFYRTNDGGETWSVVHEDNRPEAFFDAIAFTSDTDGIAFSDPVDGRFLLVHSHDAGKTWQEFPTDQRPAAGSGEAAFAASGTCLISIDDCLLLGLGGGDANPNDGARILKSEDGGASWTESISGIAAGESAGVFSIAMANRDHGVAVGGDYNHPELQSRIASFTTDGGQHWRPAETPPRGYRSCVAAVPRSEGRIFVACGPTGCDITADGGRTWRALSDEGFHAIGVSRDGTVAVASGADGKIGVWKSARK
jgi:photosystem II stability/assembly factor-like uncharacterized protein